jgi:hypothetical protein
MEENRVLSIVVLCAVHCEIVRYLCAPACEQLGHTAGGYNLKDKKEHANGGKERKIINE